MNYRVLVEVLRYLVGLPDEQSRPVEVLAVGDGVRNLLPVAGGNKHLGLRLSQALQSERQLQPLSLHQFQQARLLDGYSTGHLHKNDVGRKEILLLTTLSTVVSEELPYIPRSLLHQLWITGSNKKFPR